MLPPVLDAWVDTLADGDEVVVVMAAVAGVTLASQSVEMARWPPERWADEVLAPLTEGLDVLHAHGLAHGAVAADSVVLTRLAANRCLPVLLGPADPAAQAASDREALASLARSSHSVALDPSPVLGQPRTLVRWARRVIVHR